MAEFHSTARNGLCYRHSKRRHRTGGAGEPTISLDSNPLRLFFTALDLTVFAVGTHLVADSPSGAKARIFLGPWRHG